MALEAGSAIAETGLAGALQMATEAAFGDFINEDARAQTAKFNDMLATTIINYFKTHAEIKIKTTDEGLQQYNDGVLTTNTTGPETDKRLTNVLL